VRFLFWEYLFRIFAVISLQWDFSHNLYLVWHFEKKKLKKILKLKFCEQNSRPAFLKTGAAVLHAGILAAAAAASPRAALAVRRTYWPAIGRRRIGGANGVVLVAAARAAAHAGGEQGMFPLAAAWWCRRLVL
jgi:hypothetical protein